MNSDKVTQTTLLDLSTKTSGSWLFNTGAFQFPATPPDLTDLRSNYFAYNAVSLVGNLSFAATGTNVEDVEFRMIFAGNITPNAFSVTFFGTAVPAEILADRWVAIAKYKNGAWHTFIFKDMSGTGNVRAVDLAADAVTTAAILDGAVTLAKLSGLVKGDFIYGDAAGNPAVLNLANDGRLIIGDTALGAGAKSLSGPLQIDKSGLTSFVAGSILDADINSLDAAKLTGTIDVARIAAKSVPSSKLSDMGKLGAVITSVGTAADLVEKIAMNVLIPAGTLADGDVVRVTGYGTAAANANAKSWVMYLEGNAVASNSITTAPNGVDYTFDFKIQRASNTSALVYGNIAFAGVASGVVDVQVSKSVVSGFDGNDTPITIGLTNGVAALADITLEAASVTYTR